MRKLLICVVCTCIAVSTIAVAGGTKKPSYTPPNGFVPDSKTAIAIAVAVWSPIYGEKQIQNEKPFTATLKNGVWTVVGSLPEGYVGGVALAEISKKDGRILRVIHGK